jgi:hypothetical protein
MGESTPEVDQMRGQQTPLALDRSRACVRSTMYIAQHAHALDSGAALAFIFIDWRA